MVEIFKNGEKNVELKKIETFEKECWINVTSPSEKEIKELEENLELEKGTIAQVLNTEEISRVNISDKMIQIFLDVPIIEKKARHLTLRTYPLGIIIVDKKFILTMCSKEIEFLNGFKNNEIKDFLTAKEYRFTLQVLSAISTEYLRSLKLINEETEKAEKFMERATKNNELLKLLSIDKSLVYLTTSLKANEIVFKRLLEGDILTTDNGDKGIIEDAIIKNKQAIELSMIYKDILRGLTTSFATLSSNNLNNIMKFLAGITIVLSIPTMIASFMGMNVPFGIFGENEYAFLLILALSLLLSFLLAIIFKRRNML